MTMISYSAIPDIATTGHAAILSKEYMSYTTSATASLLTPKSISYTLTAAPRLVGGGHNIAAGVLSTGLGGCGTFG
ncbi:MAG: hypothetical protein DRO73_07255 [Candidatus Thorarchaeota archaeon]|nr:MAG: hypothetical protein DRO73_07255 [Candidatus Thorarchaeota archaeon]